MRPNKTKRLLALTLIAMMIAGPVSPAVAHNQRVHQSMTDYAYHLALAMSRTPSNDNVLLAELTVLMAEPGMSAFFAAARDAVPKLMALRNGLPDDSMPCSDEDLLALIEDPESDKVPNWPIPSGTLGEQTMGSVIYPVTTSYAYKNDTCELDKDYRPIGSMGLVNPAEGASSKEQFQSRDYTGVTLGYWAAGPDREIKDWIFRSTTLEFLTSDVVTTLTGAGVSALVAAGCSIGCLLLPLACPACPAVAFLAGETVIDAFNNIDPSAMDGDGEFTGLGHFLDVKSIAPGDFAFDDQRGKFMERAGPAGDPDLFEEALIALFDLLGWHLRHDLSQGPANYEIFVSGTANDDFRQDSIARSAFDWEVETGAHTQFTPVDNLAMWGWTEFKAKHGDSDVAMASLEARRLGWPLHAIGDATSPMHVVGATGFGHRPYEDSVDNKWEELVFANPDDPDTFNDSRRQAREIIGRALAWRTFILEWRATNGPTFDVPVRDLVTLLSNLTLAKAAAEPGLFNAGASLEWQFGDEAVAEAEYNSDSLTSFQRDTVIDGVAAALALLISATEVLQ